MKAKIILFSVVALAIGFTACKKADAGPAGPTGPQGSQGPVLTGNLKGFIGHYDLSGAKITTNLAGDSVSIDGGSQVSVTDANGLYNFSGLTTGVYNLTVKRAGYGLTKIQSAQFTGGGDTYRNANISKIPTTNLTTFVAYDTTINAINYIRFKGTLPAATNVQSIIAFVGIPGSTIANASPGGQISSNIINVAANATSFAKNVPTSEFYDLGYASGNTAYFAGYIIGGNTAASSYNDLSNNKTIYTALSSTALLSNAAIQ